MIHYTIRCLTLNGYMVDCPHIERLGYGGDGNASTLTVQTMYNLSPLYSNWMQACCVKIEYSTLTGIIITPVRLFSNLNRCHPKNCRNSTIMLGNHFIRMNRRNRRCSVFSPRLSCEKWKIIRIVRETATLSISRLEKKLSEPLINKLFF